MAEAPPNPRPPATLHALRRRLRDVPPSSGTCHPAQGRATQLRDVPPRSGTCHPVQGRATQFKLIAFGWHVPERSEGRGRSATKSTPSGDAPRPSPEAQGRATQLRDVPPSSGTCHLVQGRATQFKLIAFGWHVPERSEGRGRSATKSTPSGDAPRPSPEAQGRATQLRDVPPSSGTCHPAQGRATQLRDVPPSSGTCHL